MMPQEIFERVPEASALRWSKAISEMTNGYAQDPEQILFGTFPRVEHCGLIVLRDIQFVSLCEHHLFPFSGVATVGYVPKGGLLGLSKLARLVDCFAKRFQLQERLTSEVASALMEFGSAAGAGCSVRAKHSCMTCRGVQKDEAEMVTTILLGDVRDNSVLRDEFMRQL
jgi:GTP cyclohydrolase I